MAASTPLTCPVTRCGSRNVDHIHLNLIKLAKDVGAERASAELNRPPSPDTVEVWVFEELVAVVLDCDAAPFQRIDRPAKRVRRSSPGVLMLLRLAREVIARSQRFGREHAACWVESGVAVVRGEWQRHTTYWWRKTGEGGGTAIQFG